MSDRIKTLSEVEQKLTPAQQTEVITFANKLLQKEKKVSHKHIDMSWAGALKEYKEQYISMDLQKKALEWLGV